VAGDEAADSVDVRAELAGGDVPDANGAPVVFRAHIHHRGVVVDFAMVFCQLAWSIHDFAGGHDLGHHGDVPLRIRFDPLNTITASTAGCELIVQFLARLHHCLASPKISRPERSRAYSTQ